jgi:hypothetical protein
MTLDDYVPAPHFRERHSRRVAASPAAAWDALLELRLSDVPLTRGMMALGALPARLSGREPVHLRPGAGIIGAVPVPVLASVPQRWLVAAGVGRPWRLRSGVQPASPPRRAEELRAFDEPGWVKLAIDFSFRPMGGETLLRTETRVRATDARSRALFAAYFVLVRPGSGLMRRDLLRAVALRAERPR